MNQRGFPTSLILISILALSGVARAQDSDDPPKIEVGLFFTSLTISNRTPDGIGLSASRPPDKTEAGFGGRFTFNLTRNFALEGEGSFFPHSSLPDFSSGGRQTQGQFGVKGGKRFGNFGVFAKARPGFVSFGQIFTQIGSQTVNFNGQQIDLPLLGIRRKTFFSMDLGGVLEFYPSRRVLTRLDVGDTIINYGSLSPDVFSLTSTTHNLQVSAGIGIRLLSPEPEVNDSQTQAQAERKMEFGGQFSSLGLTQHEFFFISTAPISGFIDTRTQPGFGGRFTYNLTPNFALEVQSDFYPRDLPLFNGGRSGGRILQGNAGIKAGKRFAKFGVFGKARPGAISFSQTAKVDPFNPSTPFVPPTFRIERSTFFAMDVGGVLEFYPSRRIVSRFDGGDTIVRFRETQLPFGGFPPGGLFQIPAQTTHNFQFSAGVGFRF